MGISPLWSRVPYRYAIQEYRFYTRLSRRCISSDIALLYSPFIFVKVKHKGKLIWGIFAFAVVVEVLQYFGVASHLGFAKGSIGYIILGNHFSWADIICYAIGCLILQLTANK